ncbi:MAG TPA: CDC27 family protein [Hydrogenophaga sp.]|uniref:CDC27 family protein n=1 Tax=Hydrogenophaga sp. TaxID=1904254 RepID=UPI002B5E7254|nr:CDC27 family protein [Hydrogenophaga sp.]HSX93504.1 CDC27 family protein [Hydrogenophaga sp.]
MHHHTHPDPEVALLVEQCTAALTTMRHPTDDWVRQAASGRLPVGLTGPLPCDARKLAAVVNRLCDEQAFGQALPAALMLASRDPDNAQYAFLLATCLQRVGQPAAALMMFGMAGLHGGSAYAAAATFRSGECLAAMGRTDEAIAVFDTAIEASRQDPTLTPLQRLAESKAEALRAHRSGSP